jgi:hypothetical protein
MKATSCAPPSASRPSSRGATYSFGRQHLFERRAPGGVRQQAARLAELIPRHRDQPGDARALRALPVDRRVELQLATGHAVGQRFQPPRHRLGLEPQVQPRAAVTGQHPVAGTAAQDQPDRTAAGDRLSLRRRLQIDPAAEHGRDAVPVPRVFPHGDRGAIEVGQVVERQPLDVDPAGKRAQAAIAAARLERHGREQRRPHRRHGGCRRRRAPQPLHAHAPAQIRIDIGAGDFHATNPPPTTSYTAAARRVVITRTAARISRRS